MRWAGCIRNWWTPPTAPRWTRSSERRVGKANGSRECAPDDKLRAPTKFGIREKVGTTQARLCPPYVSAWLIIRARRGVERLERFLELRRDRDVEPLAGRQARDEPFVVERDQIVVGAELAERPLDHGVKLRLALAEHDAVGVVGQIVAGDAKLVLRLVPRDQAVQQNIVGRERVGLAVDQHLIGLLVIGRSHDVEA